MRKLAAFSRHLAQATAACMTTMTKGNVAAVTLAHWQIALTTGLIAGVIGVTISFTRLFRSYKHTNGAPLWGHGEALPTVFSTDLISLVVSFSPVGATVERLKQPDFDDVK
jgi:hypothetical protein